MALGVGSPVKRRRETHHLGTQVTHSDPLRVVHFLSRIFERLAHLGNLSGRQGNITLTKPAPNPVAARRGIDRQRLQHMLRP